MKDEGASSLEPSALLRILVHELHWRRTMLKATLMATAAAGALIAVSAFTPAAAQHPNWDWNNSNADRNNPMQSSRYYRGPAYGYGYGYAPDYGYGPSFYIGVGPAYGLYYGPSHYHW
jgi:hypothetical protein